jgi:predicted ATPase
MPALLYSNITWSAARDRSLQKVIIDRIEVAEWNPAEWPFTVPSILSLARSGMDFVAPVTFLVGENGTGKSTIIEAIAERFGIDGRGGHGGRRYASIERRSVLGDRLRLLPPMARRSKTKSFFLRSETAKGVLEAMSDFGVDGYGERHSAEVSHGESFLQVLDGRFVEPGLYLLDEPESPFSFRSCLSLLARLHLLADNGSQIICATHSPLLTALPGAQILELSGLGIQPRAWRDLDLTQNWLHFLADPDLFLRHLLEAD